MSKSEDLKQQLADHVKEMNILLSEKRTIENLKRLREMQRVKTSMIARIEAREQFGDAK